MQLREIRHAWETHAARALMLPGHEVWIEQRSHLGRGLEIEPTEHRDMHASEIDRREGAEDSDVRLGWTYRAGGDWWSPEEGNNIQPTGEGSVRCFPSSLQLSSPLPQIPVDACVFRLRDKT